MRVDLFDFDLPAELIAQAPVEPRDAAKLLHVADAVHDLSVRDLPSLMNGGDVLVVNDTRVLPCRLSGKRRDAKIEVTLHKQLSAACWRAFARPAKKLKPGDEIVFAADFMAHVTDKLEAGEIELTFNAGGGELMAALEAHGVMPLPPYIKRQRSGDPADRTYYQTLFAAHPGAAAAPTAGLHFTEPLMASLEAAGVRLVTLTLHVGAGTFLPVKVDDTADHVMHAEWATLSEDAAAVINAARAAGGRVTAVGSTALRTLETAADTDGTLHPFSGETDIFIEPGYRFRAIDRLFTNFHLPRSTLFMLVAAFAGLDRMQTAYGHAKSMGYRFYSYGDACLLEPNPGTWTNQAA